MSVKLIIFDLDGVLVDAKDIHFIALNKALGLEYMIPLSEHLSVYDGLKTNEKLELLTKRKGLSPDRYKKIWEDKQKYTLEEISRLNQDFGLINIMRSLRAAGYKIACCSNSIRRSVFVMLSRIGVIEYMDIILSNEDVKNSKPHPEMYWRAMSLMGVLPEDTLIVEDAPPGLLAAKRSSANILRVSSPEDVTLNKIYNMIGRRKPIQPKWQNNKLNVLIPMAGAGSRFAAAGYTFPKPLIDVKGKPMIQVVVENLNIDAHFVFIVQKEHRIKYNLQAMLSLIAPGCSVIEVDGVTEGACCTTLLAKALINNDNELLIANSDQFIEWDSNYFFYKLSEQKADGGIVTFEGTHPKWSFANIDKNGFVTEVAEKNPISNHATAGVYWWKHGKDYVKYAERMIANNTRYNNEFYVCPVYNEAIKDGADIRPFHIEKMWGLGTPEDLTTYLNEHK